MANQTKPQGVDNHARPRAELAEYDAVVGALILGGGRPVGEQLYLRTARKRGVCTTCGRTIFEGERYIDYMGETLAYQSGSRYCLLDGVIVWWDWLSDSVKRAKQ